MENEKVLLVKAPCEIHSHLLWLLEQIEGVRVWQADDVEDLLFGKILELSDKGDYVEASEVMQVLDEAQV